MSLVDELNNTIQKFDSNGVKETPEFRRIFNLPVRYWEKDPELPRLVRLMTKWLKTSNSDAELWSSQAIALCELYDHGGLLSPLPVGGGKTLISLLAPTVLDAKQPVLLLPAPLKEDTIKNRIPELSRDWKIKSNIKVISYSKLGRTENENPLLRIKPDLIVCDEVHYLKNRKAARTGRVMEYLAKYPNTKFVSMSGTITDKSIMDYWHLLIWTFGEEKAPVPKSWIEARSWADAIDPEIMPGTRRNPGVLKKFCRKGENVREGFRNRLITTPGVVTFSKPYLGSSLIIKYKYLDMPRSIIDAVSNLRQTWEIPNGDFIKEALDLNRHEKELVLGFYYVWDPNPPIEWLLKRKEWFQYIKNCTSNNRGVWTELQVRKIAEEKQAVEWLEWEKIKDSFKPNTKTVWIDDFAVKSCSKWLHKHNDKKKPGICWVTHTALGKAIAKESGFRYYGSGKKDSLDIVKAKESIIASVSAHHEGKNLQHNFAHNLITNPSSNGKIWEQLLGRTHRKGQKKDQVIVDMFLYARSQEKSFEKALENAEYLQDTLHSKQKLLYANIVK